MGIAEDREIDRQLNAARDAKPFVKKVDNQPAYWLVGEAMGKTQPYSGIPPTRRCYPLDRIPTKKLYDKHRQISGYRVLIGAALLETRAKTVSTSVGRDRITLKWS